MGKFCWRCSLPIENKRSFDLQPYQNPPPFFTGRKLRPPGIGIEATENTAPPAQAEFGWLSVAAVLNVVASHV